MQFKTALPSITTTNSSSQVAIVTLDQDYINSGADVRVYYTGDPNANPNQPFSNELILTNGVGEIPLSSLVQGTNTWLLNSKYYLHNLSNIFTNGINALQPIPLQ
jgi:hypothetical protein